MSCCPSSEKQLTWAAGTALAKITESDNLNESLVEATRAARSSLDGQRAQVLKNFDAAAAKSEQVAKNLGVPVGREYKANLDLNSISIRMGGLTLHDGDIPLRQPSVRPLHAQLAVQPVQHALLHIAPMRGLEEPVRTARIGDHLHRRAVELQCAMEHFAL